jgi:hypothetical protein
VVAISFTSIGANLNFFLYRLEMTHLIGRKRRD